MSYISTSFETDSVTSGSQLSENKRLANLGLDGALSIDPIDRSAQVDESTALAPGWVNAGSPKTPSRLDRWFRKRVFDNLGSNGECHLHVLDGDGSHYIGPEPKSTKDVAKIEVLNPRAYRYLVFGGALGAAESYLRGYWRSPDLVHVMTSIARHTRSLERLNRGMPVLKKPQRYVWNWLRRNTRRGSRKNISAHYDLSNEFFSLMLDETMTYSSGIFTHSDSTLLDATVEKYDRICRKLSIRKSDHVLEIGCGWGGFAIHAAKNYGCRVTAVTISKEQYDFARQAIDEHGLQDRIELILRDYRDLQGTYDKLVSIEMIEAVGEKYLDQYFEKCSSLVRDDGMMLLQSIMIPDDRFDRYRSSVDFIQRYIFPGGFLPSTCAIGDSLRRATDFRVASCDDFGLHYAETLARWRRRFWNRIDDVRRLGFDDRFIRTWDYYLCYCEAGFRERQIGVAHWHFLKPGNASNEPGIPFPMQ